MSGGLREHWGLPAINPSVGGNEQFGQDFRAGLAGVNQNMQVVATHGGQADHQKLDSQRQDLIKAYQTASALVDSGAHERVIAAVGKAKETVASKAAGVKAGREAWQKREADFEAAVEKIGELEDAGHPDAAKFRTVGDAIRNRVKDRDFQQASSAFDQLSPKLEKARSLDLLQADGLDELSGGGSGMLPGGGGISADVAVPEENHLQLLFEQKTIRDRLNEQRSYPGREADEKRLAEIDQKLQQPMNKSIQPPPKDPRVAELAEKSRFELSQEMDPDTTSLVDRKLNGKMIEDWYGIRHQLEDYLKNIDVQNQTSKDIGDAVMKAWSKAIYDVGELRRILANNVIVQHREWTEAEQKKLEGLNRDLGILKAKNKKVEEDLAQIKDGVKWANRLLKLNDAIEIVHAGVHGITKLGINLATAKLAGEVGWILTKAKVISDGINDLAQYYSLLTVASQGYSSVGELENAIKGKVDQIKDSVTTINYHTGRRERAQKIYDTAVSEAPK